MAAFGDWHAEADIRIRLGVRSPEILQCAFPARSNCWEFATGISTCGGPARAVIPLAAGILHMPNSRFWVANMVSANVWAPGVLFPGANSRKGCRSPRSLVRAA
jgi:hypothetical protein